MDGVWRELRRLHFSLLELQANKTFRSPPEPEARDFARNGLTRQWTCMPKLPWTRPYATGVEIAWTAEQAAQ